MIGPTTPGRIVLGGRELVLRYSIGAVRLIRDKTGFDLFKGALASFDESQLTFLIAEGLRHEAEGGDPNITEEMVTQQLQFCEIEAAIIAVVSALSGSMIKLPTKVADPPTETTDAEAEAEAAPEDPTPGTPPLN